MTQSPVPEVDAGTAAHALSETPTALLVDVRTPGEFAAIHAEGSINVPLHALREADLGDEDRAVYVICRSGRRSRDGARLLRERGFRRVTNVAGGLGGWSKAALPTREGEVRIIPIERQVRIAAGLLVTLGVLLGVLVHPVWLLLPAGVGAGLTQAGITDSCAMGSALARMPWNHRGHDPRSQES